MPQPQAFPQLELPVFGEGPIERELSAIARLISEGRPGPAATRFVDDLRSDEYYALFVAGFLGGFWTGGRDRAAAWLKDCQDTLEPASQHRARGEARAGRRAHPSRTRDVD